MDIRQVTETISMIEGKTSISELLPWGFPYWTVSIRDINRAAEKIYQKD